MDFDFISDSRFNSLLERDYKELQNCMTNKCSKSVLILSGSIIEAALADYFINNLPPGETAQTILKKDLFNLIELAHSNKIISQRSKELSSVIRSYRNLIHPGKEIRENEKFDNETATIAFSLVKIVCHEIRLNFQKRFAFTAEEIMSKLERDYLSYTIFENLIDRVNYSERIKLLNNLTDYPLIERLYDSDLKDVKPYIQILKPLLGNEIILSQLHKLVNKVANGSEWEVLELYYLYNEDLLLLKREDRELVITYALGYLSTHFTDDVISGLNSKKMFSNIGKYLDSDRLKESLKKLLFA